MISIDEFKNVEIKVAKILDVQDHPNADRLYVIKVNVGDEERQIVGGVKSHYDKDSLIGKSILVVANLAPANLRGQESHGMLLAARTEDDLIVISPDRDIPPGIRLS